MFGDISRYVSFGSTPQWVCVCTCVCYRPFLSIINVCACAFSLSFQTPFVSEWHLTFRHDTTELLSRYFWPRIKTILLKEMWLLILDASRRKTLARLSSLREGVKVGTKMQRETFERLCAHNRSHLSIFFCLSSGIDYATQVSYAVAWPVSSFVNHQVYSWKIAEINYWSESR